MNTRAAIALPCILVISAILPAARIAGDEPPAQDPPLDYASWKTANGITGDGADADSDGDGIPNGIEFVIGGDPSGPGSDSNSLLPAVTVDATNLNFIFRRTEASAAYDPFAGCVGRGRARRGWNLH